MYTICPSSAASTAIPASAMASRYASWDAPHMVLLAPPERIWDFPSALASPMDRFSSAPLKPAISCPEKWLSTSMES